MWKKRAVSQPPAFSYNYAATLPASAPRPKIEVYTALAAHRSWPRLLWRFLFDRDVTLFSRVVRNERNQVALHDPVKPDVDALRG